MVEIDFSTAYRSDIEQCSGGWIDQSETVKRKISALTREYNSMWIGIASDGETGLRERWNQKYKRLNMKHIVAVYVTESDSFRKKMEALLIEFYRDHVDNERGGGGGPIGSPPYLNEFNASLTTGSETDEWQSQQVSSVSSWLQRYDFLRRMTAAIETLSLFTVLKHCYWQ
eukprot:gene2208-2411_t